MRDTLPKRMVLGSLSLMRSITGLLYLIDSPKSPWIILFAHLIYCCGIESLRPNFSRWASNASCLIFVPCCPEKGSPGCIIANAKLPSKL